MSKWDAYDTCSFESDDDDITCSVVVALRKQIQPWIPVSQPPEPDVITEYEVWLDFPVDDGLYSTMRMYAMYYIDDRDEESCWFDRNGNVLEDVTHYRNLPAPPEAE